jgi:subtilisin-like proprotein convertase family protein
MGAWSTDRTARGARLAAACSIVFAAQLCLAGGASANTFNANAGSLGPIPDGSSPAGSFGLPRDVTFTVPPGTFATGSPNKVAVTITAQHTFVGDLDIELISPGAVSGQLNRSKTILSRTGATTSSTLGDGSSLDGTYTFVDSAPSSPSWWSTAASTPEDQPIFSGFYRTSAPGPGAGGGSTTTLSTAFAAVTDMNGTWTLRVRDGDAGRIGEITGASLELLGSVAATPTSLGTIPDGTGERNVSFPLSGYTGSPAQISVGMTFNPVHTYAGDLDVVLRAPDGTHEATIFSRTGLTSGVPSGDDSDLAGPYLFFDNNSNNWWSAASSTGSNAAIPAGSYRSSDSSGANTFIDPAFTGVSNANGTWTLRLRDVVGQDSGGISAARLSVLEGVDTSAPATPTLSGTDPASPSASGVARFKGSAAAGTIVRLHTDPFTCAPGSVVATGTPAQLAGAGIPLTVSDNATTNIAASTIDASGNVSGCSNSIAYQRDTSPPNAPTVTGTDPASPANENFPKFKGTDAEGGSTVRLYDNATCSEPAAGSGSAAAFNGAGITVEVPNDAAVTLRVAARDAAGNQSSCSNPVTYVEDSTSATPTITGTDPPSPANSNAPKLKGSGADADATVLVYKGTACTGPFDYDKPASDFNGAGIPVSVADNASQTFVVEAYDVAGNGSACSAPFTYTEDSIAPATPTLTGTDPASGTGENSPRVKGTAEVGSTVDLFTTTDCSGAVLASGPAAALADPGIAISVADNSTSQIRAVARDVADNPSACSGPISYTEVSVRPDTSAPQTTASTAKTKVKTTKKSVKVAFALESSELGSTFECSLDGAEFSKCSAAPEFNLKTGKHTLAAVAIDSAGNRDQSPAELTVKVKRKKRHH